MWTEVPTHQQNGIITGYNITYKSQTECDNGNVAVNVSVRQMDLTSLNKFLHFCKFKRNWSKTVSTKPTLD